MLGQYTTIPNVLFMDERLPRSCIIVFGILQSHSGINGEIYPSYETIAKEGGISRRTAIRSVKQLEFYGYLIVEKGTFKGSNKQASNYYILNPNPRFLSIKNGEVSVVKQQEKNVDKYVDKSSSYPQNSVASVTPRGCQNVTPNNNRNELKPRACACVHTRENFPDKGEQAGVPSSCETLEIIDYIGQDSTKKRKSAFDANAGLANCGNNLCKNGFRVIQGGKA